jgi:NAD(P)-dependent dehydrogenase (short-subunit alcohol dehydrogenase family)
MIKNVLITGASRGLGTTLTELYLSKEYTVFIGVRNAHANTIQVLKDKYKDRLQVLELDVSNDCSVKAAGEKFKNYNTCLDIIINNAAIHSSDTLEDIDFDKSLEMYNINTLGPLRVIKNFLPYLEKGTTKVLANISSEAGSIGSCPRKGEINYCMSKAALNMQSVILQNYLKKDGIKVLAVHPGWMKTDMGGKNADIEAAESAMGIYNIIEKYKHDLDSPMYLDYKDEKLKW